MMKKICFITTISTTLTSFVLDTANHLHKSGKYDITFICNDNERFRKSLPQHINFIPVEMSRGIDLSDIKAIFKLAKVFKREKFDYIQYSTPNAAFFSSIAGKLVGAKPRVYGQWGLRYVGESGLKRVFLKFLEKLTCTMSTHIRSVSHKNMDFAISERLYKKNKVKVIGNGGTIGVDMGVFDITKKDIYREEIYNQYNISSNEFVFGFVGRMSRDKGSGELLMSFKSLIDKGYQIRMFIVGDIEDINPIDNELIKWARESTYVIFTGRIDGKELCKYYAAFDCYVHPTYREGFGMVLQEAGAMGNAIITTDIPGASEVMEKDVSCKLVKARDWEALESEMEYLINNPDDTDKLGRMAYERTCKLYERSIMLGNIQEDIENILGE